MLLLRLRFRIAAIELERCSRATRTSRSLYAKATALRAVTLADRARRTVRARRATDAVARAGIAVGESRGCGNRFGSEARRAVLASPVRARLAYREARWPIGMSGRALPDALADRRVAQGASKIWSFARSCPARSRSSVARRPSSRTSCRRIVAQFLGAGESRGGSSARGLLKPVTTSDPAAVRAWSKADATVRHVCAPTVRRIDAKRSLLECGGDRLTGRPVERGRRSSRIPRRSRGLARAAFGDRRYFCDCASRERLTSAGGVMDQQCDAASSPAAARSAHPRARRGGRSPDVTTSAALVTAAEAMPRQRARCGSLTIRAEASIPGAPRPQRQQANRRRRAIAGFNSIGDAPRGWSRHQSSSLQSQRQCFAGGTARSASRRARRALFGAIRATASRATSRTGRLTRATLVSARSRRCGIGARAWPVVAPSKWRCCAARCCEQHGSERTARSRKTFPKVAGAGGAAVSPRVLLEVEAVVEVPDPAAADGSSTSGVRRQAPRSLRPARGSCLGASDAASAAPPVRRIRRARRYRSGTARALTAAPAFRRRSLGVGAATPAGFDLAERAASSGASTRPRWRCSRREADRESSKIACARCAARPRCATGYAT